MVSACVCKDPVEALKDLLEKCYKQTGGARED